MVGRRGIGWPGRDQLGRDQLGRDQVGRDQVGRNLSIEYFAALSILDLKHTIYYTVQVIYKATLSLGYFVSYHPSTRVVHDKNYIQ